MTPLLLTLLAAGKAAPAAEKPKLDVPGRAVVLVVADDADGAKDAAKVQKNLELALKDSAIELADVASMFPAKTAEPEGEKRFKDGLAAYDNLDLDAAELKFKEALTLFIDYPETASAARLATTHLFLGGIALQKGGKQAKKKALEELSRALVFKPDVEVDPKFFGPDVKKLVEKAEKEIQDRPTAKLELHCEPGTEVTVRGKAMGTCPVPPVAGLPLGRHLVQFSRLGYQPSGVLVDLGSEGAEAKATMAPVEKYAATLADAKKLAQSGWDSAAVPKGAWELSERLKARYLVMVRLHGGAASAQGGLQVWDPDSGNKLKDISIDTSQESSDSATLAVKTWLASPSPATGTTAVASSGGHSKAPVASVSQETEGGEPVYKKPWFWGVVGGVVAAGVITTVVVVAAQPHGQPFNPVLNIP